MVENEGAGFDINARERKKKKAKLRDCDGPVTIRHNLQVFVTDCDGSVTIPDFFLIVTDFSVTILNLSVTNVFRSLCACFPSQLLMFRHNFRHKL